MTRLELRISHRFGARDDLALDQHDRFGSEACRRRADVGRAVLGVERHLNDARTVAQVDEGKAAEISGPMYPASEPNGLADVRRPQGTAQMCSMRRSEMVRGHPRMIPG